MARKKEVQPVGLFGTLKKDTQRSLWAVFLLALAFLLIVILMENAGPAGVAIDRFLGKMLGWGRYLLVPGLFVWVYLLLSRRTLDSHDQWRVFGGTLVAISVLGFTHIFQGSNIAAWKALGLSGDGAGLLGLGLMMGTGAPFGIAGGSILLFAIFTVGVLVLFHASLDPLWRRINALLHMGFQRRSKEPVSYEDESDEEGEVMALDEVTADEVEDMVQEVIESPQLPSDSKLREANIESMHFSGDDDNMGMSITPIGMEDDGAEEVSTDDEEAYDAPNVAKASEALQNVDWKLPSTTLLEKQVGKAQSGNTDETRRIIVDTLKYFGIEVEPGETLVGPAVTQYTFRPKVGVKLSKITTLSNDLALALAAHPIRIEAPIPGKSLVGIEVPNKTKAMIRLRQLLESPAFKNRTSNLTVALGQNVSGELICADLAKMPHILIAGATNSGKSVCVNTLLLSLLYANSPADLQLILVDPKRVELSLYRGIPHLKTDVIVDNAKVVNVLKWAVAEMERRYKLLESAGSRDIFSYRERMKRGEKRITVDKNTNETKEEDLPVLPWLVIVIDEMADLMMSNGKEVEAAVVRLAQMARAVGIHLVLATQRPSVEVITGLIKANIPARIAFSVTNQIDSRTILDASGAEKLLGKGDMLYSPSGSTSLQRIQGVFVSEDEVHAVVEYLKKEKDRSGWDDVGAGFDEGAPVSLEASATDGSSEDDMFEAAKEVTIQTQRPSTTYLQTALGIGYPKAARLTALLEKHGVIGVGENGKKTVLIAREVVEDTDIYAPIDKVNNY